MLESIIAQEIDEKGPLPQSRFMELALQHPLYGYYRSQEAVGQDFTTSPEISQVFGELIGAWAIDYYLKLNQPKKMSLIELGPGKGTLMADFLRMAKVSKSFSEAINVTLVEMNSLLKTTQRETIKSPTTWGERLEDIPTPSCPVIIIANEFFDALPCNCFTRQDNVLYERRVGIQEGKLVFTPFMLHESEGPDQTWEESPSTESLINEICTRLLNQMGAFLCIDYGYETGGGDSLQALFGGESSDPLTHVGRSDLTCHVDFGHLKKIALSRGLAVLGPLSQRHFLKTIGFDIRIEMLKRENPAQITSIEAAATRLTHPLQMGTLFKVMAIFSPPSIKPAGFEQ
ncbi:MAG TPA: SAM-dependent methyltransferase [Alphaproteobacteria bacterium]|nr:SAM-dependent methyltransferase [Alphaproteobacteria bacterium]